MGREINTRPSSGGSTRPRMQTRQTRQRKTKRKSLTKPAGLTDKERRVWARPDTLREAPRQARNLCRSCNYHADNHPTTNHHHHHIHNTSPPTLLGYHYYDIDNTTPCGCNNSINTTLLPPTPFEEMLEYSCT